MFITINYSIVYSTLLAAGSVTALPGLADTGQAAKVTTQTDKYRVPTSQPGFKKVAKKYKQAIPIQILGINDLHGGLKPRGASLGRKPIMMEP